MFKKKFLLVTLAIILQVSALLSAAEPIKYEYDFAKGKIKYIIEVPEGFKIANAGAMTSNSMMAEHIPQNENINNWSEIMTVILVKNANNPLSLVNMAMKSCKEEDPKAKTTVTNTLENGVPVIYGTMDQACKSTGYAEHELMGMKVVCNFENIWMVQYAVHYDPATTTEKQKEMIMQHIKMQLDKSTFKHIT